MKKVMRRKSPVKAVVIVIAGFLLVFSLVSMTVSIWIYNAQFPRYERHDETVTAGLRYTDIEARFPRRLVGFASMDHRLQGYVYGEENDRGLVVVAHGIGGGADSYLPQIAFFAEQGFRVFAYDATGSFDSEGRTTRGFPQAVLDLNAALEYIKQQPESEGLPVLLFGHSWGGYAVANVLHYGHDIAGVVTVSGANSAMDMIIEQGRSMMGPFIYTQYPFLWLYQRMLFGSAASFSATEAVNTSGVPVLIVHGTEDEMVAYSGSSIISNMEHITNPHARALSMSRPGQNGHNSLFRSEAAAAYIDEINVRYRALYEEYDGEIPYEIKQAFYTEVDRVRVQDLNRELMDEIISFLEACAGN